MSENDSNSTFTSIENVTNEQEFVKARFANQLSEQVSREVFDKEFALLKNDLKQQKSLSMNIIIGVLVAFLFTIGLIAYDIMKFHHQERKEYFNDKLELNSKINKLENCFNNLQSEIN